VNPAEDGPKRVVRGSLVKVLVHRRTDRGMRLEEHELVTTDQWDPRSGARIDRVGFLGFAELLCGGVIDRGDLVRIEDTTVGTVLGFDACHLPNHYNILIHAARPVSGRDLGLRPETAVTFVQGRAGNHGTVPAPSGI
jgi:hypothetical protein